MTATQLSYLGELVARDEAASAELRELDRHLAGVADVRGRAEGARHELEHGPDEVASAETDAARARKQLGDAQAWRDAAIRDQRVASGAADAALRREAERLVLEARDSVHIAERRASDADAALRARRAQLAHAEAELPRVEQRAAELARLLAAPRLPSTVSVAPSGLGRICEWALEARAALVVARSTVAGEREQAIRQAGELGALVTGSPVPASSMATLAGVVRSALAP